MKRTASAISMSVTFLGLVDGTENPPGQAALNAAVLVGGEDPHFAGGSYVIPQKYLHDIEPVERSFNRGAGADHRPQKTFRYRAER